MSTRSSDPTQAPWTFDPAGERWLELVELLYSGRAPRGLRVQDHLDLSALTLRSLPADLHVSGDLDLRQCQRLRRIGAGLEVGGHLWIGGRAQSAFWRRSSWMFRSVGRPNSLLHSRDPVAPMKTLPEGLTVRRDLVLSSCHLLERLPENFDVGGALRLRGCRALLALPDNLVVHGDLELRGCASLRSLPANLRVYGDLFIEAAPLETLPDDLQVAGVLSLQRCRQLKTVPRFIRARGRTTGVSKVRIHRCPRVESLEPGVAERLEVLHLEGLPSFRVLSDAPKRSLRVVGCPISTLPRGRLESLTLDRVDVEEIPQRVEVSEQLTLANSPIRSLPEHLRPASSLRLDGCPLEELPPLPPAQLITLRRLPLRRSRAIPAVFALEIDSCLRLERIDGLGRIMELRIARCPALRSLPAGIRSQRVELHELPALGALPRDMVPPHPAVSSLSLRGCTALAALPADLGFRHRIELAETQLMSLPAVLLSEATFLCAGEPLKAEELRRASASRALGEYLEGFAEAQELRVLGEELREELESPPALSALQRLVWRGAGRKGDRRHVIVRLAAPSQEASRYGLFARLQKRWCWFEGDRDSVLATVPARLFEDACAAFDADDAGG